MSRDIDVCYAPASGSTRASITFDPPGPYGVKPNSSRRFNLNRTDGEPFKLRGLTFCWIGADQTVAQSFAKDDDGPSETAMIDGCQITEISIASSSATFVVTNGAPTGCHAVEMEVTIEDTDSCALYTSRDPQIVLEGPVT